eukprot:14872876-Ditylum_brightwellii.AAC.1
MSKTLPVIIASMIKELTSNMILDSPIVKTKCTTISTLIGDAHNKDQTKNLPINKPAQKMRIQQQLWLLPMKQFLWTKLQRHPISSPVILAQKWMMN